MMQDTEPTPVDVVEKAADNAKKAGMKYVYIGNVAGHGRPDLKHGDIIAGKEWVSG